MELQAVIEGLRQLSRRTKVEVITDSTYVAQGCQSWMPGWKRNGWQRKAGKQLKPVLNVEYWKILDQLLPRHDVKFTVVKGGGRRSGPLKPHGDSGAVSALAHQSRQTSQSPQSVLADYANPIDF
jgi:ribonuclease HI